jgi:hypothetical protein
MTGLDYITSEFELVWDRIATIRQGERGQWSVQLDAQAGWPPQPELAERSTPNQLQLLLTGHRFGDGKLTRDQVTKEDIGA